MLSYTLVAPIPLGVGDFYLLNSWFYEEFPQISPCPLWVWDSSSEWKSSKDAYPQAPMKIIKPPARGFIIGEIFPKFLVGLLRDRNKYSRWWEKCKYFEISSIRAHSLMNWRHIKRRRSWIEVQDDGWNEKNRQQKISTLTGGNNLFFEIFKLLWCKTYKWNNLFLNTRRYITTWMFWYRKDNSIFYKNHMRSFLPVNNIAKKC